MSVSISYLNNLAVGLFGGVLSASFCNALNTRKNRCVFWLFMALIPLGQAVVYQVWDAGFLKKIYPLLVHVPLVLVLFLLTRRLLWPTISVLSAYLCCQLRRWLALLVMTLLHGGATTQALAELLLTLPLLLLLLRFVAPAVRPLMDYPPRMQCLFGSIPALYYCFDYLTVVYTDLLTSGAPVVVEFMPFVCGAAYLAFLLHNSQEERVRSQLQQIQNSLGIQLTQAVREIDALRTSQTLASQYRHDLRHHLQYIASCMENGQTDKAQAYIADICHEIEAQKVQRYCENETANLILSAFAGRAGRAGIGMTIRGSLPAFILVSDSDLCVLLSNALENAIHACQPFAAAGEECSIDVQFYQQADKLFLQITNPCKGTVRFEKGVPVSDQPGHGIGVQSIRAIVRRYGGVESFLLRDGRFVLRLSI